MPRTKRVSHLETDIEKKALGLMREFIDFTGGTRYLALLHRTKDGGHNKEHKRRGGFYITHTPEEYFDALVRLLTLQEVSSKPYRLYASVNARDIRKAEKQLKIELLEMDFTSQENKTTFYERLESNWAGCVMKPSSRSGSLFLLDVDRIEGMHDPAAPVLKWLGEHGIEVVHQYSTPNGWHIITLPFNPTDFSFSQCEIKKDGLLLLSSCAE